MRVAKDLFSPFAGAPVPPPSPQPAVAQASVVQAIQAHAMHDRLACARTLAALHPQQIWRADEVVQAGAASTLPSGFAALDAVLPGGGWPQGQLVELLVDAPGQGELSLLAPALAYSSGTRPLVWVLPCDPDHKAAGSTATLPYAPALQQAGVDLARTIFVQPAGARESGWAFEQALRATHLGAVLGWLSAGSSAEAEFRALRRLHLLAMQSRALVFVLRSTRAAALPSPAALRLQLVQHEGWLQVRVLKRRGRPLPVPVQLTVHPAHWRTARAAPPAAAEPVELPADTARATLQAEQRQQRWSMKALFTH
jgi:protein ImuA